MELITTQLHSRHQAFPQVMPTCSLILKGGLFLGVYLLVFISALGNNPYQIEEVGRLVSKEALEIADKSVDIAFAGRFVDDVLVVVVAKSTRKLLVVHLWFVLPDAPSSGNLR